MLSGCDYLPSIPGLGVKTSHKLLRKHKSVEGVLNAIRIGSHLKIPPNYLKDFRTAELAFIFQRVYDPRLGQLATLSSVPGETPNWDDSWVGGSVVLYPLLCASHPDRLREYQRP